MVDLSGSRSEIRGLLLKHFPRRRMYQYGQAASGIHHLYDFYCHGKGLQASKFQNELLYALVLKCR